MPAAAQISFSAAATSSACARLSIWHGPEISANGRLLAISIAPTRTVFCSDMGRSTRVSDQARLSDRGRDEALEQRMRVEGLRLQLGMILHADKPRMRWDFDDLRQDAVGRHAGEAHSSRFKRRLVVD